MKHLPLYFVLATSLVPVLSAAPANPAAERIREGEVKQEQLRGDAQRLVEQLDAMLGEYERNGLAGEETKTVQALRETLAQLGGGEMKQVVELLEKARGATDAGEAKKGVSAAYTAQKALIVQMKKLLAEHLRNQEALEISQQLTQLADRQAVNLQNGITLGQWTGGRKPENFEAAMQANLQGQQGEQAAIAAEVKMAAEKLAKFAKDPANAEMAARFQKGLAAVEKVLPNVDAAAEALKQGQLFKAVTEEKTARDAMRKLAREIAPPQDRAEALRAAQKELAKMIEDQKEIAQKTEKTVVEKDFDKWLDKQVESKALDGKQAKLPREQLRLSKEMQKRFNEQRTGRTEDFAALEDKQGDLAGKSDEAAQLLDKDLPAAAQSLKAAQEKMQEARTAMTEKNGEAATKNAKDALAAVQAAEAKVQQEIAKADAAAGKSGDLAKDLAQLQKDTHELAKQEAAAAQNPDKSGQAAIADQVQQLAKQAEAAAPQAAPAMQQAAANAQKAAQAAKANQPAQAAAAQQAAAQNLAQAEQQIAQAAAEAQQAQQALADAQKAEAALAEIIIAEQKLELDTAKAVALFKPKMESLFSGQAARQGEIQTKTDAFKATLTADLAAAVTPVGNASMAMSSAKTFLEKPEGEPAKTAELKALDELYKAQKALAQIAAEAQAQLGQENTAQEANAQQQAQAQLDQAQAAVAQAQQDLQKADAAQEAAQAAAQAGDKAAAKKAGQQAAQAMQKASGELAQAAQKAGQAAAQGTPNNEAAQEAAQQAAQAAAEAAAQAAGQNSQDAQAQAAAAQQALAQAQAAMAQAQSGLSESSAPPMPGEGQPGQMAQAGQPGQPGQPGKPGSKPGQKPGKGPGQKPGPPGGTAAAEKYEPGSPEAIQLGSRTTAAKKASFAALPPRERAVIEQSQAEKYPEEFGAQVEQYLLNLANESGAKK